MYLLEHSQLRVCSEHLGKDNANIRNARIILLQHLLPDTEELINLLSAAGASVFCILGKPFSYDDGVRGRLEASYRVEIHPYDKYDTTDYLDRLLQEAVALSKVDHKPIVILEVGGYFAKPLSRISVEAIGYIKGVVEVTTFGHNKYTVQADSIQVPIYSVARSPIKSIEATYVGRSAVSAMDQILREIGVSMAGRPALVIGFGMIGRSVAASLQANNLMVSVYDKDQVARMNAYTLGYKVGNKEDLLKNAGIIFSATAQQAMPFEDIEKCRNNAILVSVGSRGGEFDVTGLNNQSIKITEVGRQIKKYQLNSNKNVFLVRNGTAINFTIKSCPDEIVDLIHAEVLVCAELLLSGVNPLHSVNTCPYPDLQCISKNWLKHLVD